jgi:hypothetical protein
MPLARAAAALRECGMAVVAAIQLFCFSILQLYCPAIPFFYCILGERELQITGFSKTHIYCKMPSTRR